MRIGHYKKQETACVEGGKWRKPFREIVSSARRASAERLWDKARLASALRYVAVRTGQADAARALADVKCRAVTRAAELIPAVRVTIDSDYQLGMLSIRFPGRGRLHLLPSTPLRCSA